MSLETEITDSLSRGAFHNPDIDRSHLDDYFKKLEQHHPEYKTLTSEQQKEFENICRAYVSSIEIKSVIYKDTFEEGLNKMERTLPIALFAGIVSGMFAGPILYTNIANDPRPIWIVPSIIGGMLTGALSAMIATSVVQSTETNEITGIMQNERKETIKKLKAIRA